MGSVGSPGLWLGFIAFVLALVALDLGVFHRKVHAVRVKEAAIWTAIWIGLACLFGLGVWARFGQARGMEYAAGYLLEKALAVDNIFVFVVIFRSFAIPAAQQHRVLVWGIIGALALRAVFILAGGALLNAFSGAVLVFGAFLVFTGLKLLFTKEKEPHPERNPVVRFLQRVVPVQPGIAGGHFFTRGPGGRWMATSLFLALVTVEISDIVFAVDSIPAIYGVTSDPFIVFTSNIMAILGLRSLYFLLAGVIDRFRFLRYGLALVLVFVGAKMLIGPYYHVPIVASLAVIALLIGGSLIISLILAPPAAPEAPAPGDPGSPEPDSPISSNPAHRNAGP